MVLLQAQHDNYLNKPCYAAAAAMYPRPCDLPTNLRRGDFDLLFLHRQRGLIVAEIKSVGWRPGSGLCTLLSRGEKEEEKGGKKKKEGKGKKKERKKEEKKKKKNTNTNTDATANSNRIGYAVCACTVEIVQSSLRPLWTRMYVS